MGVARDFGPESQQATSARQRRHLRLVTEEPSGRPTAGVRLTLLGRRVRASVALLALLVGAWLVLAPPAAQLIDARVGGYSGDTAQVRVLPGDTLWGIARTAQPEADPRDTVLQIQRLNGLSGSQVFAGQRLVVPTGQ